MANVREGEKSLLCFPIELKGFAAAAEE